MKVKKASLCIILAIGLLGSIETRVHAMCGCCNGPFGEYGRGPERGWYGAKYEVRTVHEAKEICQGYYSGEDVSVGRVTERQGYFKVDIHDNKGRLVDVVIVDKRTGRIRSTY